MSRRNRYVQALVKLARRYRSAEAEVARAYFKSRRRRSEHMRWLQAQAFKEYSAIKPLLVALEKLYPHVDRGFERHRYEELIEKLADETRHARLIMDLLVWLGGKKLTPEDLLWLPEDKKLARIRARYSKTFAGLLHGSEAITAREVQRKDEELERAAITLTEGGGGALYQVCSRLNGSAVEKKIATVFKEIHFDELRHKDAGARDLDHLVRSRKDCARAAAIIRNICGQRLRMRNEQFGFPLNEKQLRALEASLIY